MSKDECINESRVSRNEKDIQTNFKIGEKLKDAINSMAIKIALIMGGISVFNTFLIIGLPILIKKLVN